MALPKIAEVREMSEQELSEAIVEIKRDLFKLRMNRATSQPFKPHEFKHKKHRLAQLLTVEHERKLGINQTTGKQEA
jgi:large subunit ribosomal protein L29